MDERDLYENDRTLLFIVLFDLRALLARLVALVAGGDDDGGKKIQTHDEWYEAHREQFERTDRLYEAAQIRWAKEAEERAAREAAAAEATEDAA